MLPKIVEKNVIEETDQLVIPAVFCSYNISTWMHVEVLL